MRRLRSLGVDMLEWKKADRFFRLHKDRLHTMFSVRELSSLRRSADKSRAFAMLFAAKEATLKAIGRPLFGAGTLKDVSVPRGFKVSFKKSRKYVVATCHPKSAACAGN